MFSGLLVAALAALPFVVSHNISSDCTGWYTVVEGDTCDCISAAHNVSTYQLTKVNPFINANCSNLMTESDVTWTVCLKNDKYDCSPTYTVQANDTCDKVADEFGTDLATLYANNPQIDSSCSNLYVGEVVCTAKNISVPLENVSTSSAVVVTALPYSATATPTLGTTTVPPPAQTTSDSGDNEDLPYCDDPNDDGEW